LQAITLELGLVLIILIVTLILFAIDKWRYDIIALFALLAVTVIGVIPFESAFLGFGHPAVITIAAVLIISRGLINSGFVDILAKHSSRIGDKPIIQIMMLTSLATILSTFMNNIGALAILMPVGIRMAEKHEMSPSFILMPLAFGSILGGLVTLIGTPPNIIIAIFRGESNGSSFSMFDFAPVGIGIALAGFLFLSLIGWKLIPERIDASDGSLSLANIFVTEITIPEDSKMVGKRIYDLNKEAEADVAVIALIRQEERFSAPSSRRKLRAGDNLVVRGESDELKILIDNAGLKLVGKSYAENQEFLESNEIIIIEVVITTNSLMEGKTADRLDLHANYGVNLLAIARQGRRLRARLGSIRLRVGDVLLLQLPTDKMSETLSALGCLSLAEREISLGQPRQIVLAIGIFAITLALTLLNILPVQISFMLAAVAMVVTGVISLSDAYKSINWPIIVLIGAMIPFGEALQVTGATQWIADVILEVGGSMHPVISLFIILVVSLLLSSVLNAAALAIIMAPVAINVALGVGVSIDPFLMAVAIGVSCDFITPVGNHTCAIVMGPGGYTFKDYLRVGIPLSLIVIAVAIPLLLLFWPL
jgi:di/tricarboxylate transporter